MALSSASIKFQFYFVLATFDLSEDLIGLDSQKIAKKICFLRVGCSAGFERLLRTPVDQQNFSVAFRDQHRAIHTIQQAIYIGERQRSGVRGCSLWEEELHFPAIGAS